MTRIFFKSIRAGEATSKNNHETRRKRRLAQERHDIALERKVAEALSGHSQSVLKAIDTSFSRVNDRPSGNNRCLPDNAIFVTSKGYDKDKKLTAQ